MILLFIAVQAAAMNPCEQAGTQFESTQCAWNEFQRADQELNRQYRKALAEALQRDRDNQGNPAIERDPRPSNAEALKIAQRSWITFRDAHCRVEGYWGRGGSIEPMLVNFCLSRLTRERTGQLREMWRRR